MGTIVDAYEGGGGILLTVETPAGASFDIPFAAEICTEIDVPGRRMVVALLDGLEDLGAVPAVEEKPRKRQPGRSRNAGGMPSGSK